MDSIIPTSSMKVEKNFKLKNQIQQLNRKIEEDSLVDLSPKIFDSETKTLYKKGLYITHIPYRIYRVKSDSNINLRHKLHMYYFDQYCETNNHQESI